MGVNIFNSPTISKICNDKALTHFEINKLRIPMVDTFFIQKSNLRKEPPIPYPFVIKDAKSRGGKHVFFVHNKKEWFDCISTLSSHELIIQSCQVQLGKDIRIFVVGKQIIGAVLRESASDFRANYKLGGSATWYELNEKEIQLVKKITNHFNFGMVGIDFLIGLDGNLIFNEIEDVVGSRTLSAVSDKNIVRDYITLIKKETAMNS